MDFFKKIITRKKRTDLFEKLGSPLKEEREKAILEVLNTDRLNTKLFYEYFFTNNDYLTSSIIQILGKSGSDNVVLCLDWFKEYFLRFPHLFGEPPFLFEEKNEYMDKGRHVVNSIKKTLEDHTILMFLQST